MPKAFYFIPDISGFSEFVNTTEIEHSIHIISELLELLIDTNPIGFELAEVEGDALFMYTTKPLQFEDVLDQTKKMMLAFHMHTQLYEHKRICNCGSCKAAHHLKLKFILHYGDLNFIKVKNITKPYGKDVIKAHRLLKNNINLNEYLLITDSVTKVFQSQLDATWEHVAQFYDQMEVSYFYTNLSHLKNKVVIADNPLPVEDHKKPLQIIQRTIDANIESIFLLVSNLKYRHLWDKDVKRLEFDENKINRIGTQHNCVLQFGNLNFETISDKSSDSLVYGEKTKDMMFTKDFHYVLRLDKIDDTKTHLNVELYLNFNPLGVLLKNHISNKLTKMWNEKLIKLNEIATTHPLKIEYS